MPQEYFKTNKVDANNKPIYELPTFVSFGSPVDGGDLKQLIATDTSKGGLGYKYMGAFTNKHDYVGQGLGGNSGSVNNSVNGQASPWQILNLVDIVRLITLTSPHSGYNPYDFKELKDVRGYKK